METKFKNIIIFNPFGIGDVIFSVPIIKPLKDANPGSKVFYICNKRVKSILEHNPDIDEVIVFEKDDFRELARKSKIRFVVRLLRFLNEIRSFKADMFVDLSLNYRAGFVAKLIGIPFRVGFDYRNRGKFLTHKLHLDGFMDKHVVLYNLDIPGLLDVPFSISAPRIYVSAEDRICADKFFAEHGLSKRTVMGIMPGGGRSWGEDSRYRRWPVSNFAHVADKVIKEHGYKVVIMGDKSEEQLCFNMEKLVKNNVINLGGKTSVGQFMAIVEKCGLIFCNEGGPLHIAVALGVPTVSIFGPVDEKVYGPYSDYPDRNIVVTERSRCNPCYAKFKHKNCELIECINALTVEKVYSAVNEMIIRLGADASR